MHNAEIEANLVVFSQKELRSETAEEIRDLGYSLKLCRMGKKTWFDTASLLLNVDSSNLASCECFSEGVTWEGWVSSHCLPTSHPSVLLNIRILCTIRLNCIPNNFVHRTIYSTQYNYSSLIFIKDPHLLIKRERSFGMK